MYTQRFSTCKDNRFIKVHSVPCGPDSWYTNRSVLCFTAENPRRIESNSTACLQKAQKHSQKPQWNGAHVLIHWSQSLQLQGGRWNDNKFDTTPLKIWLTKLIYFSLDQTMWDASENKLSTVKTSSYLLNIVLSWGGGSHTFPSVLRSRVLFAVSNSINQDVLHSEVFPKQDLLTHSAETACYWQKSEEMMLCSKNYLKGKHSPDSYFHVRRLWKGSSTGSEGWSWAMGRMGGRA